jgi:hypothetical protein
MKANPVSKPLPGDTPTLGFEVEANYPRFEDLPEEVREAFNSLADSAGAHPMYGTRMSGNHYYSSVFVSATRLTNHGNPTPPCSAIEAYNAAVSDKFKFPIETFDKSCDAGVEMKFARPSKTLAEAEAWVKQGSAWLRNMNFNQFSGAGTHIHVGHFAWLNKVFGPDQDARVVNGGLSYNSPVHSNITSIRGRAERLFWGYFATREQAIFDLAAPHRRTGGSAQAMFSRVHGRATIYGTPPALIYGTSPALRFDAQTPLWAYHNQILQGPITNIGLFTGYSTQNRRKNWPTIECRHFSGTNKETALRGYLRLMTEMFRRATTLITEDLCLSRTEKDVDHPALVNPFTFTARDLRNEVSDPWLLKWIDLTLQNNGEPIDNVISDEPEPTSIAPQAVAVS